MADNKITAELVNKFSYLDWKLIERKVSENELNILYMLIHYVNKITNYTTDKNDTHIKYKIIGEDVYINNLRPLLKTLQLQCIDVSPISKQINTKKTQTLNKSSTIKTQTLNKSIDTFIKLICSKYTKNNISNNITNDIISLNILEYIGITLMYQLKNYITLLNKTKLIDDLSELYKNSLGTYISIKLFINNCTDIIGVNYLSTEQCIFISSTLLKDMSYVLTIFDSFDYGSMKNIVFYAPHLLIQCDHQNIIPKTELKPRKSQAESLNTYINNFNNGVLLISNAMIGTGKTTLIVPIAQHVIIQRKINIEYKQYQLVFCCNILSVKIQAATMCFNAQIPFGMAHINTVMFDSNDKETKDVSKMSYKKEIVAVINNFNCSKDKDRIVIIGSPDAIKLLFENDDNYNINYTLFLDEPTVGLDSTTISSKLMSANVWLLQNLPKRSILSSATMPAYESNTIQHIVKTLHKKHCDITVHMVIGNEILIGCDVLTYSGSTITPHNSCSNVLSLQNIILTVKSNPFLGRLYTYNVFSDLVHNSSLHSYINMFNNINDINANSIKEKSLMLLNELTDDSIIKQCGNTKTNGASFDLLTIGTNCSYLFPNMTLIAVYTDIVKYTLKKIQDLIKDIPIEYLNTIMKAYDANVTKYEEKKNNMIASQQKI